MRKKRFIIALLMLLSIAILVSCYLTGKSKVSEKQKEFLILSITSRSLEQYHYSGKQIDDSVSVGIYNDFLEFLDPAKLYFYQSDIDQLNIFKYYIDDLIKKGSLMFFEQVLSIYNQRLKEAESFYKEILQKPFDFTRDEYIYKDAKYVSYAKNKDELREHWRKYLKYQVLLKLYTEYKANQKDTAKHKSFEQLEEQARKDVISDMEAYFKRLKKFTRQDYFSLFLNTLTQQFDAHTEYLAPKVKEDFKIYTSGELEGIGATLQQQKDGKVKIIKLVIGGPAYKSGKIEEGDKILKVAQGDTGRWVNIIGMRLDDAVRLIRGKKGTKVRLMLEKKDGNIQEVSLIRDKIIIEDSYVRSLILLDTIRNEKIGYIFIPSFYSDFKKHGRNVSSDFLSELNKLNNEKVKGIIIDLRNDGGGSLEDVVKMVGYLIKKGPVVQVRDKSNKIRLLKDNDKHVYYKGKILVMVNYSSASASEIFSAALQDYHRALIFGTTHTFGKGTVQAVLNYDDLSIPQEYKPLGALKITLQKFYRITGGSTQLKGVVPDIIFPNPYQYLKQGEINLENPLKWDKIKPSDYKVYKYKFNVEKVKKRSYQRMEQDSFFILTKQYAKFLKQQDKEKKIPLNFEKYKQLQQNINAHIKKVNKYKKDIHLKFLYTKDDQYIMQTDTIVRLRYDAWKKHLRKDQQLKEAYNIMYDMLNLR